MREQCDSEGRTDVWLCFEGRVLNPVLGGADPLSYDELVETLQAASPRIVYNLVVTAKRMYARCLESVVAEYAPGPDCAGKEIDELLAILANAAAE